MYVCNEVGKTTPLVIVHRQLRSTTNNHWREKRDDQRITGARPGMD
ncbi:hypothetical protein AMP9_3915 [plant metagenome]|uniref:Uncharacterized protein n=1 Tax=plant metagenome TaxID=1297885 RepID=A0A484P6S1_9ZZZZ